MANASTSTSVSQARPSVAGLVYVAGLAILANPRGFSGSKTITLDVQLYLGLTDQDLLIGSLRYFNLANVAFEDGPNLYAIGVTTRIPGRCDSFGQPSALDYTFVGDILWVIPLGSPEPHYLVPPSETNEGIDLNDLPTFMIDPCVPPYFHVTGVAMEVSKAGATFEVNVEQYISCTKSNPSTKQAGGRSKPTTCFLCHIPDSPKYKNGKPMPGNNRWVTICGYITGVVRSSDNSEVEQFRISVENVAFCGPYTPPANLAVSVPRVLLDNQLLSFPMDYLNLHLAIDRMVLENCTILTA